MIVGLLSQFVSELLNEFILFGQHCLQVVVLRCLTELSLQLLQMRKELDY